MYYLENDLADVCTEFAVVVRVSGLKAGISPMFSPGDAVEVRDGSGRWCLSAFAGHNRAGQAVALKAGK